MGKWKVAAESRTRWSHGGTSGGSKQGQSWENWRPTTSADKHKSLALSRKSSNNTEKELLDEVTSLPKGGMEESMAGKVQAHSLSADKEATDGGGAIHNIMEAVVEGATSVRC